MKIATALLLALLVLGRAAAQVASIPAFPGAAGFGAVATGGRGGQVLYVTNLNTSGPGSLQAALDTPGPRYVLFTVSGVINSAVNITHGDLTLAGQTSPGGIIVRGLLCDWHYSGNNCDNLIIRHIRSRPAAHLNPVEGLLDDALRLDGVQDVIIDHSSFANASDEAVQISLAQNITIQNSILAETVGDHADRGGLLLNYSHSTHPQDNIALHHNLWYRIGGRLPEISCELTAPIEVLGETQPETPSECSRRPLHIEVSANLLYDPGYAMMYNSNADDTQGQPDAGLFLLHMNWVNNYAYGRPEFPYGMLFSYFIAQPGNQLYFAGNRMNLYPDYADEQLAYCCNDFDQYHPSDETPHAQMLTVPHPFPVIEVTTTAEISAYMLAHVGAFPRDPMDRRYLAAVQAGSFEALSYEQPGADDAFMLDFDPANPPAAPIDSDGDGMPDMWETANGLDPHAADANGTELSLAQTGVEGYTNLEVYLNALADQRITDAS